MEKEDLEELIAEGLSSNAIAKRLGKCQTTILYWLAKYGLQTYYAASTRIHKCRHCGDIDSNHFAAGRYTECKKCRRREQNNGTKKNKITLVQYKGGKCELCGYHRCLAALDFHHRDPSEKDPNWKRMRHWTAERVKKEVDKCMMVCRNCHSEIHYPDYIKQCVA